MTQASHSVSLDGVEIPAGMPFCKSNSPCPIWEKRLPKICISLVAFSPIENLATQCYPRILAPVRFSEVTNSFQIQTFKARRKGHFGHKNPLCSLPHTKGLTIFSDFEPLIGRGARRSANTQRRTLIHSLFSSEPRVYTTQPRFQHNKPQAGSEVYLYIHIFHFSGLHSFMLHACRQGIWLDES